MAGAETRLPTAALAAHLAAYRLPQFQTPRLLVLMDVVAQVSEARLVIPTEHLVHAAPLMVIVVRQLPTAGLVAKAGARVVLVLPHRGLPRQQPSQSWVFHQLRR